MSLSGPISNRLRALFGPGVVDWPAHREPEAIRDMPSENYSGLTLAARYRRIGKHRGES